MGQVTMLRVSSPGKIILLGEHAVVYGKTALAASVSDLRICLQLEKGEVGSGITLPLSASPHRVSLSWSEPWMSMSLGMEGGKQERRQLWMRILEWTKKQWDWEKKEEQILLVSLAYFLVLFKEQARPDDLTLTTSSTIPLGAGLGSSAAFSVGLVTLLGCHWEVIQPSQVNERQPSAMAWIQHWSGLLEETFHENPSGLDTFICANGTFFQVWVLKGGGLGGIVWFSQQGQELGNEELLCGVSRGVSQGGGASDAAASERGGFLLTDTGIKRSTKTAVNLVKQRLEKWPLIIQPILEAIDGISQTVRNAPPNNNSWPEWMEMAQHLLECLGVSHPAIEQVVQICQNYAGLTTKLTGAGLGGCCLTWIPEGFSEEKLKRLRGLLEEKGFRTWELREVGKKNSGVHVTGKVFK